MIKRILFIDDEDSCVELAKIYLGKEFPGCQVVAATCCEDGLKLLESGTFDIAMIDQRLPFASGEDCLKTIRARWKELPIVLVTGADWPDDDYEKRCAEEGADGFVIKDAMKQMLGSVIYVAQWLRGRLIQLENLKNERQQHLAEATSLPEKLRK